MKIHDVPCGGIFGGIGEIAESKIPPNVVRGSIPTLINRYPHRRAERCLLKPNAGLFFLYMAFHKTDDRSSNPRFQCSVCAKWMRLFGRDEYGEQIQRMYGGGGWSSGYDHLAGDKCDVCDKCCNIECKRIGAERGIRPLTV